MRNNKINIFDTLIQLIQKRILIIDGAMGTLIQQHNLSEDDFRAERFQSFSNDLKGNNDILVLIQPDIIKEIHYKYLEAGADIIETDTFNANKFSQADYNTSEYVYEINYKAAQLAKEQAYNWTKKTPDKPRFVAGSIGPTNQTCSISSDVTNPELRKHYFDDFVDCYYEQVKGLYEGGVDIFLIETVFDTLNCKAAIYAIIKLYETQDIEPIPLIISGTITDMSGRTLSGQTLQAFIISIAHAPQLFAIGLNCALGPKQMKPFIEELSCLSSKYTILYPNAGMPDEFGDYKETPEIMAKIVEEYAYKGWVNIVGGCCGTTPEHIKMLSDLSSKYKPRVIPIIEKKLHLSGLEPLVVSSEKNFINIGERTNVAGSRHFAKLIASGNFNQALNIASEQIANGAQIIDINMDEGMLNSEESMMKFLNLAASEPDISKVPFMIDSSKWSVIEVALKCMQGKGIVNSLSLKEGEEKFIFLAKEIKKYGAAVLVMAFDEDGQATTFNRRIEILKRSTKLLIEKAGFSPEDIILDPNVLAIGTGIPEHNNYSVSFLEATKWLKSNIPYVSISGGISNVSFSFRGNDIIRSAIHSVFLYHAIKAGLDMGIVNAGQLEVYENLPKDLLELVEDLVLNRRSDATERLTNYAITQKDSQSIKTEQIEDWRKSSIPERIKQSLIRGIDKYIDTDIAEALTLYNNPVEIIEGPLMDGMNIVGELFGSGKMFLPQVVKSARVMKKAVSILLPYLEKESKNSNERKSSGKILLATVKGDVHDIGKNIVSIVLSCNNYEVVDLGVMIPSERIIEEAIKLKVDIIGLSGLITPSLDEMMNVASKMESAGLKIPLLIGGATTSRIHTAVKIAPLYNSPVVHVSDASKSVPVVSKLLNNEETFNFTKKLNLEYNELRDNHNKSKLTKNLISLNEARKNKLNLQFKDRIYTPNFMGIKALNNFSIGQLLNYINWTEFFLAWQLKGKFPIILKDEKIGNEAKKLFDDANVLIKRIIEKKLLRANAVFGIFPANSVGFDDIEVYSNISRDSIIATFHTLRQQTQKSNNLPNLSLADFIAPIDSGIIDYVGCFALTAGIGAEEYAMKCKTEGDDYNAIMIKVLADRLAEAFAELLHQKIRKEYWAYSSKEELSIYELFKSSYKGIRPAPGYPSYPDHTEKQIIFDLLNAKETAQIELTETNMMFPAASICGLYFSNDSASYFPVGKIGRDQVLDYRKRKGISIESAEKSLLQILGY